MKSLTNWVQGWNRKPAAIRKLRLAVESLEDRTTPVVSVNQNGGLLTVSLSASTDSLTISGLIAGGTTIGMNGTGLANQSFNNVTQIAINNTSGTAGTQGVRFQDTTGRIALTGSLTITGIHTVDLNNPASPLSAANITISGGRFVTQTAGGIQLSTGGTISITAAGTGDALGSAANPLRLSASFLTTNTTAGNGNQFFDLGGAANFVNVIGGGATVDAGTGTVTLTNGNFFGSANGDAFGDTTTFNLGTGGSLGVGHNETIGGLSGTGTVAAATAVATTFIVGGGNLSSTFAGTIKDTDPLASVGNGGPLALLKIGTGGFDLQNTANTFTGGTVVRDGFIRANNSNSMGTGAIALGDGGTPANGSPQFVASNGASIPNALSANVPLSAFGAALVDETAITFTGPITLNSPEVFVFGSAAGVRLTNRVTGTGGPTILKNTAAADTDVVILDNPASTNDFAGNLRITSGTTLQITQTSNSEQIPNAAVVSFDAGSTLNMFFINDTIAGLTSNAAGAGTIVGSGTLTFGTGNGNDEFIYSGTVNAGNLNLNFNGNNTQTLAGTVTTGGTLSVTGGGTLLVNGTVTNAATSATVSGNGTALGGSGTFAGPLQVQNGSAVLPGDPNTNATLSTGNATIQAGGTLGVKLSTPGGAITADQLNVAGTVNIAGANLFALAQSNAVPAGTAFTVLNNDGNDAVVGTFVGLPEGMLFTPNGGTQPYRISYVGGTGNDITLTAQSALPGPLLVTGGGVPGTGQVFVPVAGQYGIGTTVTLIPGFGGEIRVALADVNGDGTLDRIAATGPGGDRVRVVDGANNAVLADFVTFGGFAGGIHVAAGDLNGDGFADIAVTGDSADAFTGPVANGLQVRVFSGISMFNNTTNPTLMANFNGLASLNGAQGEGPNVRLGGRPAIADVNGDGAPDLLIAAGTGGGPRVCVWNGLGFAGANGGRPTVNPIANLFVFESTQRGGAFITSGDITGDNRAEIIVGGGPGGGPRLRIVNSTLMLTLPNLEAVNLDDPVNLANGLVLNNFFAGSSNNRGGVRVAVRDVDGDGRADVVSGSGTNERSQFRVYRATALAAAFGSSAEPTVSQIVDPFGAVIGGGIWIG